MTNEISAKAGFPATANKITAAIIMSLVFTFISLHSLRGYDCAQNAFLAFALE